MNVTPRWSYATDMPGRRLRPDRQNREGPPILSPTDVQALLAQEELMYTDVQKHHIPEDETLQVPLPPEDQPSNGGTTRRSLRSFPTQLAGITREEAERMVGAEYKSSCAQIMTRIVTIIFNKCQ